MIGFTAAPQQDIYIPLTIRNDLPSDSEVIEESFGYVKIVLPL
jgi:hypothetical protein